MQKSVVVFVRNQDHIASVAPIAATWSAAWNVLLPSKSETPVSSVSGFDVYANLVYEHGKKEKAAGKPGGLTVEKWPFSGLLSNADKLTHPAAIPELDNPANPGKQRVILSPADILAGFVLRSPLPYQDRTTQNRLPAKSLDTEPLGVRIAAIL